jgi:hypothetical protein
MLVYVRPSNEALLRARVPGAQGIARPSIFFLYPFSPVFREQPRLPSIARIQRGESATARCANTEDHQAPSPLQLN